MKSILAVAALASSAVAAPAGIPSISSITGVPLPTPSAPSVPSGIPSSIPSGIPPSIPAVSGLPELHRPTPSAPSVPSLSTTPAPGSSGQLLTDLGPEVNGVLTVTGQDSKQLLIQLSPEVAALLSGLGLPSVGVPVGEVVATASSVGDLLKDLGPMTQGLLTVTGQDGSVLLVQLAPNVAALVSGLGLPSVGVPVGNVVGTLGAHVKRQATDQVLNDVGKQVNGVLTVTGQDAKKLLIQLSPEVAKLLSGVALPAVGIPVGSVVASASSVGDLVKDLGPQTEGLLTVAGNDGKVLLIQLSPNIARLVSGLGLPGVGVPVGKVVATLGKNL